MLFFVLFFPSCVNMTMFISLKLQESVILNSYSDHLHLLLRIEKVGYIVILKCSSVHSMKAVVSTKRDCFGWY